MEVTFVLPEFNEQDALFVSLGSLFCQTNKNWKAIIYSNGLNRWIDNAIDKNFNDARVCYRYALKNTGTPITSRIAALKEIETEWMVSASIQDYFHPNLVEEILKVADDADFIMWNGMNHHYHPNVIHQTKPEGYWVDWCNMAVRTELAKKIEAEKNFAIGEPDPEELRNAIRDALDDQGRMAA